MESIHRLKSYYKSTAITLFLCLIVAQPIHSQGYNSYSVDDIYGITKEVIKGAAEWGFEEAGVRILGASGWKLFKNIIKPVMTGLYSKYPKLFSTQSAGSQAARDTAMQAVNWVDKDVPV